MSQKNTTIIKAESGYLSNAIKAGLLYFAGIFAIGFALGGIRIMFLLPLMSELYAVLLELPIILGMSWILCQKAIAKFEVVRNIGPRLTMGLTAFMCLILAEFLLWSIMFDDGAASFVSRYATSAGFVGLFGQILYALMPVFHGMGLPFDE